MALTDNEEGRSKTADEIKAKFLEQVHILCRTWKADKDKMGFGTCPFEGLAFSILSLLDNGPFVLRAIDEENCEELCSINSDLGKEFFEVARKRNHLIRGTITMDFMNVKIVRNGE